MNLHYVGWFHQVLQRNKNHFHLASAVAWNAHFGYLHRLWREVVSWTLIWHWGVFLPLTIPIILFFRLHLQPNCHCVPSVNSVFLYLENIDLIFFPNQLRTINDSSTWIQMTLKHHALSSRIFFVPAHFAANRSCVVLCIRSMETAPAFAWWMVNDETIPYQTLLQNSTTLKTLKTVI